MFRWLKNTVFENGRVIVLVLATILISISLLLTYRMAVALHQKEEHDVELWAVAMEQANQNAANGFYINDELVNRIISNRNNIPFIITDENMNVIYYHRIPSEVIDSPTRLQQTLEEMESENNPIVVACGWGHHYHTIYYGHSQTLRTLYVFPFIQIVIIVIFVVVIFMIFRSLKRGEQSRVWAGLAKETAHQLGTPTSSLLGWIEYLREQPVDQMAVDDMQKDVSHLIKIADRFSKIGSETPLKEESLNAVVESAATYFRKRIPRNVSLECPSDTAKIDVKMNATLFEWVIENLMKNALDALQGHGKISVSIGQDNRYAWVDVTDTGKGIQKSKWKRIFEPGYTTKTRGWGLGLSLSRRIIVDYHKGKIAVIASELDKGTTIRVTLRKA